MHSLNSHLSVVPWHRPLWLWHNPPLPAFTIFYFEKNMSDVPGCILQWIWHFFLFNWYFLSCILSNLILSVVTWRSSSWLWHNPPLFCPSQYFIMDRSIWGLNTTACLRNSSPVLTHVHFDVQRRKYFLGNSCIFSFKVLACVVQCFESGPSLKSCRWLQYCPNEILWRETCLL